MDTAGYLHRIGYTEGLQPDAETLRGLHRAHLLTIPFENLDIGLKRPIRLELPALWDKLIARGRGGFCYELNGLFAWLLQQAGFEVTYLNARVFNRDGQLGIDFDHLALQVRRPGESGAWLADVGFGDSFTEPLGFDQAGEQAQGRRAYRLERTPDGYITWQKNYDSSWERQYFFDLQPHQFPSEYAAACLYHQTSPASSFTTSNIISRATPTGRVSLEDGRLILTEHGRRTVRRLESRAEYQALLKEHFHLTLPEADPS